MLVKCMFSGSGGQGSALMAKLVCEGAMRENLKVVMTQTYGIEQRGGDSTAFIIISDEAIGRPHCGECRHHRRGAESVHL